ncbi:MAG: pyridoxal phosphate-dependent enzyme, partial [uncultured bacterium]
PHQNHTFFYKKIRKGLLSDIATSDLLFQLVTFWIFRFGFLNDVTLINKMVMTELDHSRKEQIPAEYLANMTPMQARIGLKQIADIDRKSAERIEYAKKYHEGLKDIKDIIIPPLYEDFSHIYTYFPIQYVNRNDLLKFMMRGNRDIAAQHYKNCADLPWLKKYYLDCPNARQVSSELIFLPTYPGYGAGEVDKNIKLIREYFS